MRVTVVPSAGGRLHLQPPGLARLGAADLPDGGTGEDLDAAGGELGVDQGAEFGVDGGQHLGQLLHLGDGQAAGGEGVGHLQADVTGADDHGAGRGGLLEGAHDGEGVAHRVQQVHPVASAESIRAGQAADRRPDGHRAGAHHQLVVADSSSSPPSAEATSSLRAPGSIRRAVVSSRRLIPVACRSAMLRWARLRQWVTSPGDVVGDAADREVRVSVRDDHGDLGAGVQLAGAQRGADPGVAAPDGDEVHAALPLVRVRYWGRR